MKKKILLSALVLFLLSGAAIGAYLLYEYNENKPLILKCTEKGTNSYTVMKIKRHFASYWNFAEEEWEPRSKDFKAEKNHFSWRNGDFNSGTKTVIDRNSGDYSVSLCEERCVMDYDFNVVIERGTCTKSAEPAKTLKQKF